MPQSMRWEQHWSNLQQMGNLLDLLVSGAGSSPLGKPRIGQRREKETYAIVEALKKWSGWIGFQPVVVLTDHQARQSWYNEKVDTPSGPAGRRAKWDELLSKCDLQVHYVPGSMNTVADALSRWAYPACKGLNDVSRHGSAMDAEEVAEITAELAARVRLQVREQQLA